MPAKLYLNAGINITYACKVIPKHGHKYINITYACNVSETNDKNIAKPSVMLHT